MLCYAAAGVELQFCAMQREDSSVVSDVARALILSNEFDRLCVIHIALLAYSIITQQRHQLPKQVRPLGLEVKRPRGCNIQYFHRYLLKRVELAEDPLLAPIAQQMEAIYAAAAACEYIIGGTSVRTTHEGVYSVELSPVATPMSGPPQSEQELAAAIRCVLLALQCLHSHDWGHGDLRWHNVVAETNCKYRVIDLESAVPLGSKPIAQVSSSDDNDSATTPNKHPAVMPRAWGPNAEALDDGVFTARSDLYMVGKMIEEASMNGPAAALAAKLVDKQLILDEALRDEWVVLAGSPLRQVANC
eukprot:GHUV01021859.1.p2 GENE.GHUV01021859.1~~GHUV01021859.1.p2  ORF type:complete len:303 (+),score=95.53 GHUV01021859.1:1020-1928(+)